MVSPEELMVPLGGENYLGPRPLIEISVPFRGSFRNFRRAPPSLLLGSPPGEQSSLRRGGHIKERVKSLKRDSQNRNFE